MRTLLLMRGAPGSGKSTWIKNNHLEHYTLSPDEIRLMYSSPQLTKDGDFVISQDKDTLVWKTLFEILESRMENGEFTIVDATNSKTKDMTRYKDLASSYRYKIYCVDFTDVPLEQCLKQNKMREPLKFVPENAIRNIYARFETQKVPTGIKVVSRDEALDIIKEEPFDLSQYEKIVHFGDIHGCYDTLMQYFNEHPFNDNYEYIFCGDYVDRGNQSGKTIKFLMSIMDKPNVCLLEGNHECYSKNTEFLTENGWKKFDEITNEKLAQVDLDTNLISYEYPLAKIEKESDNLFRLSNLNISQEITLGHNVVYDNKLVKLENLDLGNLETKKFKFSTLNNFNKSKYSISFLKLLIWVYADGTIIYGEKNHPNNHKCRVQFHLSKPEKMANLEKVLEENNIKYSKTISKKSGANVLQPYTYIFYGDKAREVYYALGKDKILPQDFMYINECEFEEILDAMSKTDGEKNRDCVIFSSTHIENLNTLQIAAISNGHMATVHFRHLRGFAKKPQYELRVYSKYNLTFKGIKSNVSVRKLPKQNVCCFTMPKGTLITRLNGNPIISGNCSLKLFGNDVPSYSNEFEKKTKYNLINEGVTPKDARMFYRKLRQCSYYTYKDINVLCCHGGVPYIDENILYIPTRNLIKGVGQYEDVLDIVDTWVAKAPTNAYMIHGHRNVEQVETRVSDRVFNLEGGVEFGGKLRIVELNNDLTWNVIEYDNIQPQTEEEIEVENMVVDTVESAVKYLRENRNVQEKELGNNISSFNFTRDAFMKKNWNKQTILARGLFINTKTNEIVARSYEKFFRIGEMRDTELGMLKQKFVFPVKAYVKENGFLAIVSYDKERDDLFVASKSTNKGDYVDYINAQLEQYKDNILQVFRGALENYSLVFECVDTENDPHIIKYANNKLVLLDAIENNLEFKTLDYTTLVCTSKAIGCPVKQLAYTFDNWDDFRNFYYQVTNEEELYQLNGEFIEGFVFVDANGFMTKCKSAYYNMWKHLRSISDQVLRTGNTRKTGSLQTPIENKFYAFLRKCFNEDRDKETKAYPYKTDIISLRDKFQEEL